MLILNNGRTIEERAQNASSRSISSVKHLTFNLALEFLNKCEYHCSGCYVNRRNNFTDGDLDNVLDLTRRLSALPNVELNEIVVGPTDFFATENVEALFDRPAFHELFEHFNAITITSTLQAAPKKTAELMAATLDKLPPHVHLELFVSLDVERLVHKDLMYLTTLESNLKLLSRANILFIFNMHKHPLFERYAEIAKEVNRKYNSHLKMNPSFFRGRKSELIERELREWKNTLELAVQQAGLDSVLLNVADDYFGGNTYITLSYKQGQLYINPCFYDYVFEETPAFLVPSNTVESIFETIDNMTNEQYAYADQTVECGDCELLSSCVAKKVLASMKAHDITDCLMPKNIIKQMTNRRV